MSPRGSSFFFAATATKLAPGDKVIITIDDDVEYSQLEIWRELLEENFPDVTFVLVSRATGIAVKEVDD